MAQAKIALWLMYGLGIPIYGYAILLNVMTYKGDILMGVAICLGLLKAHLDISENNRKARRAVLDNRTIELENRLKEIQIQEREKLLK